jgi:hypothetical protein
MSMLETTFFLCLRPASRGWKDLAARLTTRAPSLAVGEVCVELKVRVPKALFQRPALRAQIQVSDGAAPPVIDAQVQDNIVQALEAQLGVRVQLEVSAPECDE